MLAGPDFSPSSLPALLKELTHESLLAVLAAIVEASAELETKPGVRPTSRLVAWAVADAFAIGASKKLDNADALKLGKRLEAQGSRVVTTLGRAAASAEAQRELARSAAANELGPQGDELAGIIATIDAGEQRDVKELREEVYYNLLELDALVPAADASSDAVPGSSLDMWRSQFARSSFGSKRRRDNDMGPGTSSAVPPPHASRVAPTAVPPEPLLDGPNSAGTYRCGLVDVKIGWTLEGEPQG